jgi:hypothetical protein
MRRLHYSTFINKASFGVSGFVSCLGSIKTRKNPADLEFGGIVPQKVTVVTNISPAAPWTPPSLLHPLRPPPSLGSISWRSSTTPASCKPTRRSRRQRSGPLSAAIAGGARPPPLLSLVQRSAAAAAAGRPG